MNVYKPKHLTARPWQDIELFFRDVFDGTYQSSIYRLVQHIHKRGLTDRLFATTSLDRLLISIYPTLEFRREMLYVTFDRNKKEWHFEYCSEPFRKPEFTRIYPLEKGIEKFDAFISVIRW